MKNSVKITTLERILDWFYPCYCKGCGKPGEIFCERCYNYNTRTNERFSVENHDGFRLVIACGLREGLLKKLILDYKFRSRRAYASIFSRMVRDALFEYGLMNATIVPLPTINRHIRLRGFDHIEEICRGFKMEKLIIRAKNTVQVGTDSETRRLQAKKAYCLADAAKVSKRKTYVLVDDVWTTGASMRAACEVLREAGAENVVGIVIAKNDGYKWQ